MSTCIAANIDKAAMTSPEEWKEIFTNIHRTHIVDRHNFLHVCLSHYFHITNVTNSSIIDHSPELNS
jgi:hypothetical protein